MTEPFDRLRKLYTRRVPFIEVGQLIVGVGYGQCIEKGPPAFLRLVFQVALDLGSNRVHPVQIPASGDGLLQ